MGEACSSPMFPGLGVDLELLVILNDLVEQADNPRLFLGYKGKSDHHADCSKRLYKNGRGKKLKDRFRDFIVRIQPSVWRERQEMADLVDQGKPLPGCIRPKDVVYTSTSRKYMRRTYSRIRLVSIILPGSYGTLWTTSSERS